MDAERKPLTHGSATCKARHTRCDEKFPVCTNCERLELECRPSEFITQSTWSSILSADYGDLGPTSSGFAPSTNLLATAVSSQESTSEFSGSLTPFNQVTTSQSSQSPTHPFLSSISVDLDDEVVFLLNKFRAGLATWMDVFDFDKTYETEVLRRALHSDLLLRCICAFTAQHLSLLVSGEFWFPIASRYYGQVRHYTCS